MHSKWQIWDFFQSYPKGSWGSLSGKVVLQAFDPLALRLMKDHILAGVGEESKPKQLNGSDITVNWIEDQFLSLGLFGNSESWILNSPDDMPAASKEMLLRDDLMLDGRCLVFSFYNDSAYLKKVLKLDNVTHIQIEPPRFWETHKLVDFLCSFFKLPLNFEAKQYLLQAIDHEFMPMFDAFRLIKLNHPEKREVVLADILPLIGVERMDQFALATDMGKKSWRAFFDRLLSVETDYDRLRGVFSFLQSHLLKLADASYLKSKARLSKYDQEIQTLAKTWSAQEVKSLSQLLQQWEIDSKRKDQFLPAKLRAALLESHRGAFKP